MIKNIVGLILIIILSSCQAGELRNTDSIYRGFFIDYDGAEYERTFIQCFSDDAWLVQKKMAYDDLIKLYGSNQLSKYGELYVEVEAILIPTNKAMYPSTYYTGQIIVNKILHYSSSSIDIEECRKK